MDRIVNAAVQVLPLHVPEHEAYRIIDVAIAVIAKSGLPYIVCPFETVIEGKYARVMQIVDELQEACHAAGAASLIVNLKVQRNFGSDVHIADKTGKYQ